MQQGDVDDNTNVYISAEYIPQSLSSLWLTYVKDPYVNYTWPNMGSWLGDKPVALIGNDFLPYGDYTMRFGGKLGKCAYKSNILLVCDVPKYAGNELDQGSGDFPYGNEDSICKTIKEGNYSEWDWKLWLDCKTPRNDTRYWNPVPTGLSFNGYEWWNISRTFDLNDKQWFFYQVPPLV